MFRRIVNNLASTACAGALALPLVCAAQSKAPADAVLKTPAANVQLTVAVGKSLVIDSKLPIKRVAAANGSLVDTQAVTPKELLVNGKAPGETSLTIWQQDDTRLIYDLTVVKSDKPEGK